MKAVIVISVVLIVAILIYITFFYKKKSETTSVKPGLVGYAKPLIGTDVLYTGTGTTTTRPTTTVPVAETVATAQPVVAIKQIPPVPACESSLSIKNLIIKYYDAPFFMKSMYLNQIEMQCPSAAAKL